MQNHSRWLASLMIVVAVALPFGSSAQEAPVEGIGKPLCRHFLPVDFKDDASAGQWILGYYSGALAMKVSLSISGEDAATVREKAARWDEEYLLESARAYCANHPDQSLSTIANLVVTMVLGE